MGGFLKEAEGKINQQNTKIEEQKEGLLEKSKQINKLENSNNHLTQTVNKLDEISQKSDKTIQQLTGDNNELKSNNVELTKKVEQLELDIKDQKEVLDKKLKLQKKEFYKGFQQIRIQFALQNQNVLIPVPQVHAIALPENIHEQERINDNEQNPNIPNHNVEHQQIDQPERNNAQDIERGELIFPHVGQSPRNNNNPSMATLIIRHRSKTFPPISQSPSKVTMIKNSDGNNDDKFPVLKN